MRILHLGKASPPVERTVSHALRTAFPCEVSRSTHSIDSAFAYDAERGQCSSTLLLDRLAERAASNDECILGIADVDLFIPVLTFVFGEAYLGGAAAVFSTRRLDPVYYGLPPAPEVLHRRAAIEAVHEVGHTLGLLHCKDLGCAMHASHAAEEIDLKPARYCNECARRIQ